MISKPKEQRIEKLEPIMTTHGEIFKKFVAENRIPIREIAEILDKSEQSVFRLFKSKKFSKELICLITSCFSLNLNDFNITSNYLTSPYSGYELLHFISYPHSYSKSLSSPVEDNFLDKYYSSVEEIVLKTKNQITLVDHLGNNGAASYQSGDVYQDIEFNMSEGGIIFQKRYDDYLRKIEKRIIEQLKNGTDFNYQRIFQVPRPSNNFTNSEDLRKIFASLIYTSTLEHLSRLFTLTSEFQLTNKKYSESVIDFYYKHKSSLNGSFNLDIRVIWETCFSSYMIVDNEYLITEYNAIDNNGLVYPDCMYIEKFLSYNSSDNIMKSSINKVDDILHNLDSRISLMELQQILFTIKNDLNIENDLLKVNIANKENKINLEESVEIQKTILGYLRKLQKYDLVINEYKRKQIRNKILIFGNTVDKGNYNSRFMLGNSY